jgi:putative phage-type endonuclease
MASTEMVYGEPLSGDPFRDRRRSGIGGSDAGAILGVSPWTSALELWEQKRGIVQDERVPSERMVWGTRLEHAILAGYEEDEGVKLRKTGRVFRRHADFPFVVGHPDAIADDRIVEAKAVGFLDERWGEPGSEDVPVHYFAQVQHYMMLTGRPRADLAALVGGRELRVYVIPAAPAFQEALLQEERDFWLRVVEDVPPPPDGSESAGRALRQMFPRAFPEEVIANPAMELVADQYALAREELGELEKIVASGAQVLQSFMGARERLRGERFTATWGNVPGAMSWKPVAITFRELIEEARDRGGSVDISDARLDSIVESHRGAPSRRFTFSRKDAES